MISHVLKYRNSRLRDVAYCIGNLILEAILRSLETGRQFNPQKMIIGPFVFYIFIFKIILNYANCSKYIRRPIYQLSKNS